MRSPTLAVAFLLVEQLFAQPGTLDPTFGNNGWQLDTFPSFVAPKVLAMQPDQKIVAACYNSVSYANLVARYLPDGGLDSTWGGIGYVITEVPGYFGDPVFNALAIQADGKVVAAGYIYEGAGNQDQIIVRFLPNGSLDPTFSGDGIFLLDHTQNYVEAVAAIISQPDGKLLVAAQEVNDLNKKDALIYRLNDDASFDTPFGAGTYYIFPASVLSNDQYYPTAMTLLPDGSFLITGAYLGPEPRRVFIVKFLADGQKDLSFGTSGRILFQPLLDFLPNATVAIANAIAVDTYGRVLIAGSSGNTNLTNIFLARCTPNGAIDSTFNNTGIVWHEPGQNTSSVEGFAVIPTGDGRIMVMGSYMQSPDSARFILLRYGPDGQLDPGFGDEGVAALGLESLSPGICATIDAQGRYIVGGYTGADSVFPSALARVNSGVNIGIAPSEPTPPEPVNYDPVNDLLYLAAPTHGMGTWEMLDMNGRVVSLGRNDGRPVRLSALLDGIYMVVERNGSNTITHRFVKY